MHSLGIAALVLAVIVSPVAAQSSQPAWADDMYTEFDAVLDTHNDQIEKMRVREARPILKNEKVNLYVTDSDGQTATFSFRFDDQLQIHDFKQGERDDATVEMTTDRATITEIADAERPGIAFLDAWKNNEIKVNGIGYTNSAKYFAVTVVTDIVEGVADFLHGVGRFVDSLTLDWV